MSLSSTASTAKAADQGPAVWIGLTGRMPFAERFTFGLLAEPRFIYNTTDFRILLVRPWFEMAVPKGFSVGLGYDALFFFTPSSRTEQRIWQQASHRKAWEHARLDSRFRLEQRFFSNQSGVSIRGRLMLGTGIPLGAGIDLVVKNESFVNFNQVAVVGEQGYSENRLYGGFDRRFGNWTKLSIGYQMQWINAGIADLINHTVVIGAAFNTPEAQRRSRGTPPTPDP